MYTAEPSVINMYEMKIISLLISLFDIIKTKALECVSVINQKCIPRPKILNVNEGVGEALFYPYNVLVIKCSGSCNTLDNPMSKICVPNVIKNINMQVYNFLMRLNKTCNVLWHESCKVENHRSNRKWWNKDVEIMVPLKYLSNFWRNLKMLLINCEVDLILTWSSACVLIATVNPNQAATFAITDTKLYVPAVTLSTQENTKFLQQLK